LRNVIVKINDCTKQHTQHNKNIKEKKKSKKSIPAGIKKAKKSLTKTKKKSRRLVGDDRYRNTTFVCVVEKSTTQKIHQHCISVAHYSLD
jgi:hypothetical protein